MATKERIEFATYKAATRRRWLTSEGLVIFVGENGAGKSRLLARLEQESVRLGYKTFAIANTPYDKFRGPSNGASRLLARHGGSAPEKTLKLAISKADETDEIGLRRISRALRHCGYLPDVGLKIEVTGNAPRDRRDLAILDSLPVDGDEVMAICSVLLRPDFPRKTIWFDFDSSYSDYSYRAILPKVLRWEKVLKKLRIVKKVELFLRRPGYEVQLSSASSGELSLITTIAYLSAIAGDKVTVLVDEPENSLHPRWQREYLQLLLETVKYRGARIIVATHSPLIVSSAVSDLSDSFFQYRIRTVVISSVDTREMEAPPSVEGILAEAFNVVTPANHYLSQALVRALAGVESDPSIRVRAREIVKKYREAMPDARQEKILEAVSDLIDQVPAGSSDADVL